MKGALAEKPSVQRTESIGDYVPADQEEKLQIIASLRPLVEGIEIPTVLAPCPPRELAETLDQFGDRIDDALYLAKSGGVSEAAALESLARRIHAAR